MKVEMRTESELKDSGVEWIGKIPSGWKIRRIKHITSVKGRIGWQGLTTEEYRDIGPYLVTGTDFKNGKVDWTSCHHVDKSRFDEDPFIQLKNDDLLITKDGTIGKTAMVDKLTDKATLNSGIFVVRSIIKNINLKYLYWILNSDLFFSWIDFIKTGTTINHLYQEKFVDYKLPFLEMGEQTRISAYLDSQTSKLQFLIDSKTKQIERLREQEKSLIHHAVTKGLDPKVKLKDSGVEWIGEIPEGWSIRKLKRLCENLDGKRVPITADERISGENPYYGATGIVDHVEGFLFDEELLLIGEDGAPFFERDKDVAFIIRGKSWVNNHVHVLRVNNEIKISLLKYALNVTDYVEYIKGSTRDKLNQSNLNRIPISVPSEPEQRKIISHIDTQTSKLHQVVKNLQIEIAKLEEYKKSMTYEVVTGKVKVN